MKVAIPEAELQRLAAAALERLGVPAPDAQLCARVLVLGDLFGLGTHGTSRVESYGERLAAEQGFASIIGSNASTTIAPTGGKEARLGNSPVAFAVPDPGGRPFILDMALSVAARAKIRNAAKAGEPIPDTWATDRDGRPTTDARAALDGFLLPIGGHKGYGLALIVDLFAGLLSGAAYLTHVNSWSESPELPGNLGHFYFLFDAKRLGSTEWLHGRMQDFAAILHGTPASDPARPVRLPGEQELDNLERQRREGISLDAALVERLRKG